MPASVRLPRAHRCAQQECERPVAAVGGRPHAAPSRRRPGSAESRHIVPWGAAAHPILREPHRSACGRARAKARRRRAVTVALAFPWPCLGRLTSAHWNPTSPEDLVRLRGGLTAVTGSATPLQDFTVAAQSPRATIAASTSGLSGSRPKPGPWQGSRSILVGTESAVDQREASNTNPKIAISAVFKNRARRGPDPEGP
jgi:hypothetical protein